MEKNKKIETEMVPLEFDLKGTHYLGEAKPIKTSCNEEACYELDVTLYGRRLGTITCSKNKLWTLSEIADQELVNRIGQLIQQWYE